MVRVGETVGFPQMTPKAAQAFDDFVALGPTRSLRKLYERYRQQTVSKPPSSRLETLFEWSTKYGWQDRIASAVTALAEARLEMASEIDAGSFLKTSELIAERLTWTTPHHLDSILDIRSAVRKPATKGATVTVTIEVRQAAEKVAAELGVPVDVVLAETYRMAETES